MTSPVSTTHPNVVAEKVMALTVLSGLEGAPTLSVFALPSTLSRKAPVVRSQLAWDSTHGANVVGIRLAVNVDLATECPGEHS